MVDYLFHRDINTGQYYLTNQRTARVVVSYGPQFEDFLLAFLNHLKRNSQPVTVKILPCNTAVPRNKEISEKESVLVQKTVELYNALRRFPQNSQPGENIPVYKQMSLFK